MLHHLLITLIFVASLWSASVEEDPVAVDYSAIGLTFAVPAGWEEVGPLMLVSKADYARRRGTSYAGADSSAAIYGHGLLVTTRVDSSMLPDPAAYAHHIVQVRMEGFHGWYGRFLFSLGRKSIGQPFPFHPPDVRWVEEDVLADTDVRNLFPDGYAIAYAYQKMDAPVAIQGQIYYIIRGKRCYQIVIEGVQDHFDASWPSYEAVLKSMRFE